MKHYAWSLGLALLLAGCEPAAEKPETAAGPALPVGSSEWRVIAVNGVPVGGKGETPVTLNLDTDAGRVSGSDGCNRYTGTLVATPAGAMAIAGTGATKRLCNPGSTPESFYGAMDRVAGFRMEADRLQLIDEDGTVAMELAPKDVR